MAPEHPRSPSSASNLRSRALRLLARREFGSAELRSRLLQTHPSPGEIDALLEELRQQQWLDDARAARQRAELWHRRGYGPKRAELDLHQRGFDESLVAHIVAEVFADAAEQARQLVQTRFPGSPGEPRARARAARFLLRRGFAEDLVVAILGEAC